MNEFNNPYEFIRDNYFGNGGYNYSNSYSYLRRHPRESKMFYTDRKESAVLENLFRPLQNLFLSPIKAKTLELVSQNLILQDINKKTKLFFQATESLTDSKLYGKALFSVYTDVLPDGTPDTNALPDIESIFPGDFKALNIPHLEVKDAIYFEYKMIDNIKIPVMVEYFSNLFSKKTMAWRDEEGDITLEDQGELNRITDFDGIKYGVLNKLGLKLDDIPETFNLAQIQKLLFNLDTQRLSTIRKNGFPITIMQTDEGVSAISLSEDVILKVPVAAPNMPELLEADLTGVEMTTDIINEKKSTIYKVFTDGLFSDNIKYASTMTSLIATKSFTNTVSNFYLIYQEIIKTMLDNIIFIYEIPTTYNIDFPTIDLIEDDMKKGAEEILN